MTLKLSFVLEAVDKATSRVRGINATIDKLTAPAKRVRAAFGALVRESRFERVSAAWDKVGQSMGKVRSIAGSMLGTLTAAAVAAGGMLYGLARSAAQMDDLVDSSRLLKVPVSRLQEIGFAAEQSGGSMDDMVDALRFLNLNASKALGGDKEAMTWFERVGISAKQLKSERVDQLLDRIADKFATVGDQGGNAAKKIEVSQALMGRGGFRMVQTLELGSKGLRDFADQARKAGAVVDDEAAGKMADFNDELSALRGTLGATTALIGSAALPVLSSLIQRITRWAVANRGLIATRLAEFVEGAVQRLPAFVQAVGSLGAAVGKAVILVDRIAKAMGGWEVVIGAVAAVIVAQGVVAVVSLTSAMWGLVTATALSPFGWVAIAVAGLALLVTNLDAVLDRVRKLASFAPSLRYMPGLGGALNAFTPIDANTPGVQTSPNVPSPAITGRRGGTTRELGGTLRIEIDSAGQPRVRELSKKQGSPLDFDVYSGAQMVTR